MFSIAAFFFWVLSARLAAKYQKISKPVIGVWAGYVISTILYSFVHSITMTAHVQWIIWLILMLVWGITNQIFFSKSTIVFNCIIGSYLIIRAVGSFNGGYPNIYVLNQAISEGRHIHYGVPSYSSLDFGEKRFTIGWTIYLYTAMTFLLSLITIICNYKFGFKLKWKDENKKGYEFSFSNP